MDTSTSSVAFNFITWKTAPPPPPSSINHSFNQSINQSFNQINQINQINQYHQNDHHQHHNQSLITHQKNSFSMIKIITHQSPLLRHLFTSNFFTLSLLCGMIPAKRQELASGNSQRRLSSSVTHRGRYPL